MHAHHTLTPGSRVAVVGGGPAGIAVAKELLAAGFEPVVLERGDTLGGQWSPGTPQSAVWPGMRANTSGAMTRFSELPVPADWPLFPRAEAVGEALVAYADRFGVTPRVRFGTTVLAAQPAGQGWTVDVERGDGDAVERLDVEAVVACSGRFVAPRLPAGLERVAARVRVLHAATYGGPATLRGLRVFVLGNSISGLEIAAELASDPSIAVVSACRRPRWILPKVAGGVPSDQRWFTAFADVLGRTLPPEQLAAGLRASLEAEVGDPAAVGGLTPDPDLLASGLSQCQAYLPLVAEGRIDVRPGVVAVEEDVVRFTDGSSCTVDAIVLGTGYERALPYLDGAPEGEGLVLETFDPARPGLALVGQYVLQGPYLPVLELQARWVAAVWAGRRALADAPPLPALPFYVHHQLAGAFAEAAGAAPDPAAHPELADALLFGPMLPERYRLDDPAARARFAAATAGFAAPPEQREALAALTATAVPA